MKTRKLKSSDDKLVIAGIATDPVVCSRVASIWTPEGLFSDPDLNMVAGWCFDYQQKHDAVPNGQLRSIFDRWADSDRVDDKRAEIVESKLLHVSDESVRLDMPPSEYILDVAGRLFNRVKLKRQWEQAEEDLDSGRIDEAVSRMASLTRVELGAGSLIKPAEDYDAWVEAFDPDQNQQLFGYPGKLNWMLGTSMCRDKFIAFMAPDKSFKSFWLLDSAFRGIRFRRRVAFFDTGDMTKGQVLKRMGIRAARRPLRAGAIEMPVEINSEGVVESETKTFTGDLDAADAFREFRRLTRKRDCFRLCCYPNSTASVEKIRSVLEAWEREGWVADIVVIDYADIMAPPRGVRETLDQIDDTWKQLRRMSQELHCLVLTATQSNAAAYGDKAKVLKRQHFSGRKTKLAHVDGMVGLNVNPKDKQSGVSRVNWVVNREFPYGEGYSMPVAGCLAIGNPAIRCFG